MSNNKYWQGREELEQTSEFERNSQHEFHQSGETAVAEDSSNTSRRDFLKYVGFSVSAAALAASCEMPVRKAIPYVMKPEEMTPGVPNYYASTFFDGADFCPILVKTRDGRPIKIEGNPESSITKGNTTARTQASVLSLYDKQRLQYASKSGNEISWDQADQEVIAALEKANNSGKEILILSSSVLSPSTKSLVGEFANKYPTAKHVAYDAISYSALAEAHANVFGMSAIPAYHFDKAEVIVSFSADFLGTWLNPAQYSSDYTKNRKAHGKSPKMSRHFQVESQMSLAGTSADIRVPLKPAAVKQALVALHNEISKRLSGGTVNKVADFKGKEEIVKAAKELLAAKGKSLVVCGFNDIDAQNVTASINSMLENYGKTISNTRISNYKSGNDKAFSEAVKSLNSGKVGVAIVWNANPSFNSPMAQAFSDALAKADASIAVTNRRNETSELCTYNLPEHHYLESWNDFEPISGMYTLAQPTIEPIFKTRQFQDSLLTWMGASSTSEGEDMLAEPTASDYYSYITEFWKNNIFTKQSKYVSFQSMWDNALHDGVFNIASSAVMTTAFTGDAESAARSLVKGYSEDTEVVFYEKVAIGNGDYLDNPWLQELPDPISKTTWNHYILIPFNQDKLTFDINEEIKDGQVYKLNINGREIEGPVVVAPGLAKGTIAIALGYGRTTCGISGYNTPESTDPLGFNAFPLLNTNKGFISYETSISGLQSTSKKEILGATQTHHVINTATGSSVMDTGLNERTVVFEGNTEELDDLKGHIKAKREFFGHLNEGTMYPGHQAKYDIGHHWMMAIDMNACYGCGACVVACHAENNVPIVGRDEVIRAHEMHWLRIDRYYTGDNLENPDVVFQPMMCQHCDNAPCENVCPVSATNHSSEGLNQMAYNRCFGTRYCANNCPYKVRRFNWYDYQGADATYWFGGNDADAHYELEDHNITDSLTRMVLNPDVTVRSRGVMEKCSFCVQRIQSGKLKAKAEGREFQDGDIVTACQQACASGAIMFGDSNNEKSEVNDWLADGRNYYVVEEVNTAPSVGYLAKVRNRTAEEDFARKGYKTDYKTPHGHHGDHSEGGHDEHSSESHSEHV